MIEFVHETPNLTPVIRTRVIGVGSRNHVRRAVLSLATHGNRKTILSHHRGREEYGSGYRSLSDLEPSLRRPDG